VDEKIENKNFTTIFENFFLMYFGQIATLDIPSQKNKNGFWKSVKSCIFWYIKIKKKRRPDSACLQNEDNDYAFLSILKSSILYAPKNISSTLIQWKGVKSEAQCCTII